MSNLCNNCLGLKSFENYSILQWCIFPFWYASNPDLFLNLFTVRIHKNNEPPASACIMSCLFKISLPYLKDITEWFVFFPGR